MDTEKKKYWIKIEKNFLNNSHIKVIKNMQNGRDYIIFYLSIMLESTNTEGHLRFNELVPYNEEMLASVTDTNVDIVRSAMKIFQSLGLVQMLENGTIFLPDVPNRIGKEGESAERVRLYREKQLLLQSNISVTKCNDNKDKDKDKKEDKDKTDKSVDKFKIPLIEDVKSFCEERKNNVDFKKFWYFYDSKNWYVGKNKIKNWKSAVITWEKEVKKVASERNYSNKEIDNLFDNIDDIKI